MRIDLDSDQLYEILKSNPKDTFDLKIDIDKNDSLKSVYLVNQNEKFKLNLKTKYERESKIDIDKIE